MFGHQAVNQVPYHPLMFPQMMSQMTMRQPFNMTPVSGFAQPTVFPYRYPTTVNSSNIYGYPVNYDLELLKLTMAAQSQMQNTMPTVIQPSLQSYLSQLSAGGKAINTELSVDQKLTCPTTPTIETASQKTEIVPKIELMNEDSDPSAASPVKTEDDHSVGSVEKVSASKKIKKENTCGHHDKPHYARGLCNNCYHKHGRTKKPWLCSHEKLYAHGLCQKCYKKASRKNLLTTSMKNQIKKMQVYSTYGPKVESL